VPDDFRSEVVRAENVIKQQSSDVRGVPIAVKEQRSLGRQQPMDFAQTIKQERGVFLLRSPKIREGKSPCSVARVKFVDLLREERRIDIHEIDAGGHHIPHDVETITQADFGVRCGEHFPSPAS